MTACAAYIFLTSLIISGRTNHYRLQTLWPSTINTSVQGVGAAGIYNYQGITINWNLVVTVSSTTLAATRAAGRNVSFPADPSSTPQLHLALWILANWSTSNKYCNDWMLGPNSTWIITDPRTDYCTHLLHLVFYLRITAFTSNTTGSLVSLQWYLKALKRWKSNANFVCNATVQLIVGIQHVTVFNALKTSI